jgi:protein-S-isoprenylcysteine O-methyltransferase Ste14
VAARDATMLENATAVAGVRPSRTISDLVGCACFAAFALMFPLTAGRFGLLLLPPMLYELTVAVTFLVRGRARRSLQGAGPRAAAYVATFWMPLVFSVTLRWAPNLVPASTSAALRMAGASLWLFGSVVAFWPVWHLRRSFSIEPAARALRTDGPYRLARHPIYATQILIYSGIFLLRASPVAGLALLVWLAVVRVRIAYEERVLCAEYPEYELYRSRVGAFGPWPRARHAVPAH